MALECNIACINLRIASVPMVRVVESCIKPLVHNAPRQQNLTITQPCLSMSYVSAALHICTGQQASAGCPVACIICAGP